MPQQPAPRQPPPRYPPQQQPRPPPQWQQQPAPRYASPSDVEVVEEFEPIEEISEEEYLREKRRLRRQRAAGLVGATVLGVVAALLLAALFLGSSILPPFIDNFKATPLEATDLTAPAIPDWAPVLGDPAPTPTDIGGPADARYTIIWTTTSVFAGRGGTMRVNVTNNGQTDIYVQSIRFVPEWEGLGEWFGTTVGRLVAPNKEVPIGLIGFSGPSAAGSYTYHFEVDLMAKRRLTGTWADMEPRSHDPFEMEVLPIANAGGYPIHANDGDIYRKVNDLIKPGDPKVIQLADDVRAGLGTDYNVFWVASLFDWVITTLEYRSDPSDDDIWSPPGDTLTTLTGDCEDYSILISSVVEHWGGNSRFYIISGHAFAAVFAGNRSIDTLDVANALNSYYGTSVIYSWFVDELGYWIIADGTSSQYLGGLPYSGAATDMQGGWDIKDTEYLYITDIYPGYPE